MNKLSLIASACLVAAGTASIDAAVAQDSKPNILFIMGDDIGWFNIGAYHRGIMAGGRPISIGSPPKA